MELYLIRHGQSSNNALANMNDRTSDPDLTDLGRQQAQLVAQHLAQGISAEEICTNGVENTHASPKRGFGITKLYCSAMHRALQTCQPISQALGLTAQVWVDIHEKGGIYLDHGQEKGRVGYPGLTRSEILAGFPDYHLPDEITIDGWWNNGYEDWPVCQGRAIKVVHQLRDWADNGRGDERIALVSHGGFMDALLKALCDQLPSKHIWYHHFNTALTRVDFRDNGGLSLRYLNRIDHLPPECIS
jgi:broad specificity phosphatase PhoE